MDATLGVAQRFVVGARDGWELALELFNKMHRENCKPNVVTYNSLIAACAHGAQQAARIGELLDSCQRHTAWC